MEEICIPFLYRNLPAQTGFAAQAALVYTLLCSVTLTVVIRLAFTLIST